MKGLRPMLKEVDIEYPSRISWYGYEPYAVYYNYYYYYSIVTIRGARITYHSGFVSCGAFVSLGGKAMVVLGIFISLVVTWASGGTVCVCCESA
jgi:hypothetical protein